MKYTIAAIPTLYRGRMYRSRLEARWAAFFDALGWEHEYEPFDLGLWSPDFLLPEFKILVEVKPIDAFDYETFEKMWKAARPGGVVSARILLVGVAPPPAAHGYAPIGWYGDADHEAEDAVTGWLKPSLGHRFSDGVTCFREGWETPPKGFVEHANALWAEATNTVQWKPPA